MTSTTARAVGDGPGADWFLAPCFILRIAGLPFRTVDALRFDATAAWASRMLDLEEEVRGMSGPLADRLESAIAAHVDDKPVRRELINLRREVFNGRRPRHPAHLDALAARLTASEGADLGQWRAAWARYAETERAGAAIMADELARRRSELARIGRDRDLRGGVLLASPVLDRQMDTYVDGPPAQLRKRERQIERSLLEYLFRTACKTSPFSSLTAVCLGRFTPGAGDGVIVDLASRDKRSFPRLNMAELSRLSSIISADDTLREDLVVQVTSGWRIEQGRIRYLRRRQSMSEDDTGPMTVDPVHESLFHLPAGELLEQLLKLMDDDRRVRLGDLSEELAACAPEGYDRQDITDYLGHLLRLGLLVVPDLQVDIHAARPLDGYILGLRDLGRPWASGLAERLEQASRSADAYHDATLDRRRVLLDDIHRELTGAHADLGRTDVPPPRTVLYEDTTYPTRRAVADRDHWEGRVLPALREVARIFPVFDMNLPRRLVTKGFFRARHGRGGRCDDFLAFAHEFNRDFFEHYTTNMMRRRAPEPGKPVPRQENWLRVPEIDRLDDAREAITEHVGAAYHALPAGATELVLGDEFVDAVRPHLPETFGALDPRSFFAQLAGDRDDPLLVINRIYNGLTLLFSRFSHCFPDADGYGMTAMLRETLARARPSGAVFAELRGGYDATNLNLHPAVTPYELVCPGELSLRPPGERIPMEDLYVADDVDADCLRLYSRRLGVEVIPVYLGFLLPLVLPEVQQVLLNFSYLSMAQVQLWTGAEVPLPGETIAAYPRVRYKNVVLHRRMWKLHPNYLPHRAPEATDAEHFLDWARWRRRNGIPRRVFATPDVDQRDRSGDDDRGVGAYKPLFVDFENYFSLDLLESVARKASRRIVLTEMLPDADDLWLRHAGDGYVTEFTFELDGVNRRPTGEEAHR